MRDFWIMEHFEKSGARVLQQVLLKRHCFCCCTVTGRVVTLKESSYVYALNKQVPVRAHGHTGRFCVQVQWRAQLLCGWQAI